MKIFLELRSGPNAGIKLPLAPGQPLRIGRNPQADHPFPDDKLMSILHFAIDYGEKSRKMPAYSWTRSRSDVSERGLELFSFPGIESRDGALQSLQEPRFSMRSADCLP
jgi:hypothetical protein